MMIVDESEFDWETYINVNPDLLINNINNKQTAWKHWQNHGKSEERPIRLINNTNIHNGRFGNLFFVNMALHFIALKINLKCRYKYFDKFSELGIHFYVGENEYNNSFILSDFNFLDIIKNPKIEKKNIIINNDNWFQTTEFVYFLNRYFKIPYYRNNIINNNFFKKRYNNNNDVFIHVRLDDVKDKLNSIEQYYDYTLSQIVFESGYISSDSIKDSICQKLIKKYNLIEINKSEIETIMFASTCNNIVLSGGTYSWMIGFFAFFSKNIYYPFIKKPWYGNIFCFKEWKSINLN
jgi:hypothetical protein